MATPSEYGDVSGKWYNELGSVMELTQSENGALGGVYKNMAPDSSTVEERVIGSLGKGVPATLGFTVNFEDGKYTTSWSGQYFKEAGVDNKEVLLTTWLMTANLQDSSEYWESTNIGQDRFTREQQKPKGRKSLAVRHLKDQMK